MKTMDWKITRRQNEILLYFSVTSSVISCAVANFLLSMLWQAAKNHAAT